MFVSHALHSKLELMIMFLLLLCKSATSKCEGSDGLVCCVGFAWNDDKGECEKCPVGYHSQNCSEKCIYPSYGEDCQEECQCTQTMCDFITGCSHISSSVIFEWQKTTAMRFHGNSRNISDMNTLHMTDSITRADFDDVARSNTPITIPINSEHIVYGVFALIVVFIVLFAAFVSAYIYKQCNRYNINRNKPEVNITQQRQYQGLMTQPEVPVTDGEVEAGLFYLQPISHQHYEEIVSLEINAEDTLNGGEDNAYLSPIKEVRNIYTEVINDSDQVYTDNTLF